MARAGEARAGQPRPAATRQRLGEDLGADPAPSGRGPRDREARRGTQIALVARARLLARRPLAHRYGIARLPRGCSAAGARPAGRGAVSGRPLGWSGASGIPSGLSRSARDDPRVGSPTATRAAASGAAGKGRLLG